MRRTQNFMSPTGAYHPPLTFRFLPPQQKHHIIPILTDHLNNLIRKYLPPMTVMKLWNALSHSKHRV